MAQAQPKIVDLADYRRARRPAVQEAAAVPPVVWVPVWLTVPAWRPF